MSKSVSTIQNQNAGSKDTIEVIDESTGLWARVRVRESGRTGLLGKASIFLSPDELDAHGRACIALAADMKARR